MSRHICPNRIHAEGNSGGSYISMEDIGDGKVALDVGETCVQTVRQEVSVVDLAVILTWAKDYGFQKILDEYYGK